MANGSNPQLEYVPNYSMESSTVRFDMAGSGRSDTLTEYGSIRSKDASNEMSSSYRQQQMPNMNLQNNLNAGELMSQ